MTLPTKRPASPSASPRQAQFPNPGDIVRDGITGEDVVVKAEDLSELKKLDKAIWTEAGKVREAGYILGAFFNEINQKRLYLAAGFEYMKTFLEERYSPIGRATAMRLMKISRAFDLRVSHGRLALPEFCSLEHKKNEALARLPEEMRASLREKGKFTVSYDDGSSGIISVAELQKMTRQEVLELVSAIVSRDRVPRYKHGQGIAEALPDLSPEAAKILELIKKRTDMILHAVTRFKKLGEKEWTKVQRKRVADELRGVCDVLLRKSREIDPTKGRNPSSRNASPRQGKK